MINKQKIKTKINYKNILVTGVLVGCFIFYAFYYNYHLFFIEQMQLFPLTWGHFLSYFSKPAAISCYLGDFFTQFYYLKGGGAIVITISLAILWWLLNKVSLKLSQSKWAFFIPMIIVMLTAMLHTNINYTLAPTISFIIVITASLAYSNIPNIIVRYILSIALIPVLYILVGSYFFLFIIFVLIFEFRKFKNRAIYLGCFVLLAGLFIGIPLSARSYYYLTINQAFSYPNNSNIGILPDFELEKILSLDSEWYFNRPEKIIELVKEYKLKHKLSSYYENLALSTKQNLPTDFFERYQPGTNGLYIPLNRQQSYATMAFSNEVYYYLGDVNAAQHCALLATTFSPKCQSSRMARRLAQINIINEEYAAAEKYIKMLKKTWFHCKWAKEMEVLLYNEQECNNTPWLVEKRAQVPKTDYIKENPNDFEDTLLHLLKDTPENNAVLDYLLCYYLLTKNLNSFYKIIIELINNNKMESILPLYQEALLIYFTQHLDDPNKEKVHFSPTIFKNFINYNDAYAVNKGNGINLEANYGKTYWFYYHYATLKNKLSK